MIRRFGPPPEVGRTYVPRPGAYAILLRGDRILLTCQTAPNRELQLPGGGVDPGETPLRALHREVMEETGWRIAGARRIGAFRRFVYMPEYRIHAEKICHLFLARPAICLGPPSEPDHVARWMDARAALPRLSNAGDAHFLARIVQAGG